MASSSPILETLRPRVETDRGRPGHILEICPVDPPRHYVDDFGDARYVGGFHYHTAVDVMASEGTPIRAPFDGVAESSVSWAGGLSVYVHGVLGFVFNAHLSKLGRMGKVHSGDIVGYVGNSGDALGHSPHDHFEWHPGGGSAVDPFSLLNESCGSKLLARQRPPADRQLFLTE